MTSVAITPEQESPEMALHRAGQERQQADARLAACRGDLINLIQARHPHVQARLGAVVRGLDVPADVTATLTDIDQQIAALENEIRPLMEAIATRDAELTRLRQAANRAADEAVQEKARALYGELVPVLVRLEELSHALMTLHVQNPGTVRRVTHQSTVKQWLEQARALTSTV